MWKVISLAQETFLTPDWIKQFQPNIFAASVVMVDANLPPHSLEVACQSMLCCITFPSFIYLTNKDVSSGFFF